MGSGGFLRQVTGNQVSCGLNLRPALAETILRPPSVIRCQDADPRAWRVFCSVLLQLLHSPRQEAIFHRFLLHPQRLLHLCLYGEQAPERGRCECFPQALIGRKDDPRDMFSTSYFVFSYQPVSPPIFSHLRIRAAPPIGIPCTAQRRTSAESSWARWKLFQRLCNHLPNLDGKTPIMKPPRTNVRDVWMKQRGKMKSLLHHGTSQIRQNWLSYLITPKYHCMSAVVACLLETGRFCLCCGPLYFWKKSSRTFDSSLDAHEIKCGWVPTRWQSNEEKLPEEATVSYNFNQLSGLDRMGRAAVEKSVQKLVFFRALHQTCKSYLWVHQKVKSIFILWDSFSFCSEQPREKNSFCLVWVWELVQQSDTQSEDWALILECYKKSFFFIT